MNYLGHAFLSFKDPEILVGNMIGDFVKGKQILETFPAKIKEGIVLHRAIDSYTDQHPANSLAKQIFRPEYHLYAGAFVDTLYDHFLANDPQHFSSENTLLEFTQDTYATIDAYLDILPEKFQSYFQYMKNQNWLYHYRTVKGIEKAYNGLAHRATNIESSKKAYQLTMQHYYELNQRYYEFIDDVVFLVKKELSL